MTTFGAKDPCAIYRPVLTDWVERRAHGPTLPSAFEHLDRCRRCELELTEVAQTVVALRRLGERAATVEPPADGWRELRARLEATRPRRGSTGRSSWSLTGSLLGPAVVAVLAIRIVLVPAPPPGERPDLSGGVARFGSIGSERPLYDSGSQRLTEAIVLVLGGPTRSGDRRSAGPAFVPASMDRRDVPPAARPAIAPSDLTPPRTAARS